MSRKNSGIREYELVYIIQPDLEENAVSQVDDRVAQTIANQGGTITKTELWGKRRLAYPIQKHFEGHYILHHMQMLGAGVDELERFFRFNEDVIRFLTFRLDA